MANPADPNNARAIWLLQRILSLHEDEMNCQTCGDQLDCLAELVAVGHDASKLLPAVMKHLECCKDCREEFEALVFILKGQNSGQC